MEPFEGLTDPSLRGVRRALLCDPQSMPRGDPPPRHIARAVILQCPLATVVLVDCEAVCLKCVSLLVGMCVWGVGWLQLCFKSKATWGVCVCV